MLQAQQADIKQLSEEITQLASKLDLLQGIAREARAAANWEQHLAPAEYGTVMVLARDRSPRNHVRAACTQELAVGGTIERSGDRSAGAVIVPAACR